MMGQLAWFLNPEPASANLSACSDPEPQSWGPQSSAGSLSCCSNYWWVFGAWAIYHWSIIGGDALQFEPGQFGISSNSSSAWFRKPPASAATKSIYYAYCCCQHTGSNLAQSCRSQSCSGPQCAFQSQAAAADSGTASPNSFGTATVILINSNRRLGHCFCLACPTGTMRSWAWLICSEEAGSQCWGARSNVSCQFGQSKAFRGFPGNSRYLNLRPCDLGEFKLSWTSRSDDRFKQTNFQK